jgi:hypothetical protein
MPWGGKRRLVASSLRGRVDARVIVAVWVCKKATRPSQLGLEPVFRFLQVASQLVVFQLREMPVLEAMRPDLDASIDEPTEFVPRHNPELARMRSCLCGELWDVERTPLLGIFGAHEHRCSDTDSVEDRQSCTDAAEGIVECDVEKATPVREGVFETRRAISAAHEALQLTLQRARGEGQRMRPLL